MKIRKKWITAYLLAICLLLSCFLFTLPTPIFASDNQKEYSSVLTDLQKDTNFHIEDYPVVLEDYSLNVIQIAESTDKELFVYVYQPSGLFGGLQASSMNISTSNLNFVNYKLSFCNSYGTVYKYLVEDFVVSTETTREYEITAIYRPFDKTIDKELTNGNIIIGVDYPVSKKWIFTTTEIGTTLYCHDIETIEITDKYVGFVRYEDGDWWHLWGESACDRHFVAFSTNKQIDKLIEADVYYQTQSVHLRDYLSFMYVDSWEFGEIENQYAPLTYSDKGNYDNGHYDYTWDRIQSVDDFVNTINVSNTYSCGIFDVKNISKITDEALVFLSEQQWVLSFVETPYEIRKSAEEHNSSFTRVGNVSILRLQFETDGVVYNMGAIDNQQSGSEEPINSWTTTFSLNKFFAMFLGIVLLILIIVFCPWLFKVIWWIISAPFKFIGWIINKAKKNKADKKSPRNKRSRK